MATYRPTDRTEAREWVQATYRQHRIYEPDHYKAITHVIVRAAMRLAEYTLEQTVTQSYLDGFAHCVQLAEQARFDHLVATHRRRVARLGSAV